MERHWLSLGVALVSLIGCTTCTLSMPLFSGVVDRHADGVRSNLWVILSGKFFEVLVGLNSEPLWRLLGKIGILSLLEPVFTVLFVVKYINTVWEKVMSSMRALIVRRVLAQKVEFFDTRWEKMSQGTSDLGSLKDVVSENVSRDRGFRALSEAMYKRSTIPIFKAHGLAQASIADFVTETLSAICTVRSFGGEKRLMLVIGFNLSK